MIVNFSGICVKSLKKQIGVRKTRSWAVKLYKSHGQLGSVVFPIGMAEFPILDSHRLRTFFPHTPTLRHECSSKAFRTTMELTFLVDRDGRNLKRAQSHRACAACRRKKVHSTCLSILSTVADQCIETMCPRRAKRYWNIHRTTRGLHNTTI